MRQFGTPTNVLVGDAVPPAGEDAPPPAPPRRRRVGWVVLAIVVVAAAAAAWSATRGSSDPSVDKAGVNSIVDNKVKKAVDDLKSEPAPGVAVSASIRPALVVVQSES